MDPPDDEGLYRRVTSSEPGLDDCRVTSPPTVLDCKSRPRNGLLKAEDKKSMET